jgi:hypothetical protein
MHCPAEGVAWIVLFNSAVGNVFDKVMPDPLIEARRGPLLPSPPNPNPRVTIAPEVLAARVGLYMNQDSRCQATLREGELWLAFDNGWGENRLSFVGEEEAWVSQGPQQNQPVRFLPSRALEASRFEMPLGVGWDFLDGPSVQPGPVGPEYDDRLGSYHYEIWGKNVGKAELSRRNGWLYFDDIRLSPYEPGLFFSGAGETVDLRSAAPSARNIPLHKT